ncbi:structural maintenance of chromosomes protein 2 [Tanacetum coccineum]
MNHHSSLESFLQSKLMGKVRSKAQQIIKNRDLRGRVTTIPLNRIKNKHVHPQVQKAAIDLVGEGNAEVALLLVGYADEVKNAMEFMFGETSVCKTNAAAEKVWISKGLVGELTKVKNNLTMTALEICAGEKLFNIVVKSPTDNRDLRGRVTTIPLNRIKSKHVHPQVQKAAIDLVGKGNAEVALLLVGYADEVKNAMEFVFGETSVCKTNAAAEKVAFDRRVKTRSVTLEGDLFQSGGLVTGGSVRRVGDQLRQLHALGEAYSELSLHEKRLSEIEAKINALVPLHEKYNELKQQLEVKAFRLKQSQNTAEQNEHHKLSEIVKRIKQELEEAKSALTEKHAFYEESVTKVANLVISVQDHANNEDGSLKTRAEKIEAVKKKMQSAKKNLKGYEKEREKLIMKVEALKQEYASLENQLVSLQNEISTLTSEVDLLKIKVTSLKDEHSQAQSEFNTANTKLVECDSQISCIRKEQEKRKDRIREKVFEQKRLESEVKHTEVEQKNRSVKVDKLINKHAWITS